MHTPSSLYEESPEKRRAYTVRELVDTPRAHPDENEDVLLIHRRNDGGVTALIADGATGVGQVAVPYADGMAKALGMPRISGGRFASLTVAREIESQLQRGLRSPKELLLVGAERLCAELQKIGVKEEHFTQVASTLGAIADLDPLGTMRWACIRADVSVLVLRAGGTWEWYPSDHPLDYYEGKALSVALRNSPTDISHSLDIDQEVQQYINHTNRAGENMHTYGSLNGADRETLAAWIEEGETEVVAGDRVYLFTDGFLPEKARRAYDSEEAFHEEQKRQREHVVMVLRTSGAEELLSLVRSRQRSDPTCAHYPRFKAAGDDATLIEITVS
jgi:hypothetical protein